MPEGATVEVRLLQGDSARVEAFARVRAKRINRPIGMDEIIEEDKRERDERADAWFAP